MLARHDATGSGREGGGGGSPESEDLPLVASVPLEEGGNVLHRPLVFVGVAVLALAVAAPALAIRVHIRVEGASATIFGATEPRVTPVTGAIAPPAGTAVTVSSPTPLGALERASQLGEFFYRVESFSFGPYVAQVGRLAGSATTGWVYKVNGVSPPVAADQYVLREGDRVLWYHATFGPSGGPKTLRLARLRLRGTPAGKTCFDAILQDDNGRSSNPTSAVFRVDGRRVRGRLANRVCPAGHWHTLRATAPGAVRSQVVSGPRGARRPSSGSAGPALAGRR